MGSLSEQDRDKLNGLYSQINNISLPECRDTEAKDMVQKVGEGLVIIKEAIKEVATILKQK